MLINIEYGYRVFHVSFFLMHSLYNISHEKETTEIVFPKIRQTTIHQLDGRKTIKTNKKLK